MSDPLIMTLLFGLRISCRAQVWADPRRLHRRTLWRLHRYHDGIWVESASEQNLVIVGYMGNQHYRFKCKFRDSSEYPLF